MSEIVAPLMKAELPSEDQMLALLRRTCDVAWKVELSVSDVDEWLRNFKGEVHPVEYERQLALWLLLNFVQYSHQEVMHLCKILFRRFLHAHLVSAGPGDPDVEGETAELLRGTLFYQLGRPGESGAFVLYMFRQANALPTGSFVTRHDRIPKHVERIAFVDDVCLTGEQAEQYLRTAKSLFGTREMVLLTLIATPEAELLLQAEGIRLVTAHILDERAKCFSQRSDVFSGLDQHRTPAKDLAKHYGAVAFPARPLGYNSDAYAFGFFYNTPDNSLPIFWAGENDWNPIMKRYHKMYGKGGSYELSPYV